MTNRPRIRVAILSSYPPDHATFGGGVQTATAALLEGLRELPDEVEVHLVTSADVPADVHSERDGITFHFLAGPRARWARPRFPWRVAAAARTLKTLAPDLVHCQDTIVLALAGLRGPWRKLFSIHGIKRAEARLRTGWERPSAAFEALLERRVHRRYDAVVCNSAYAAAVAGDVRKLTIPNAVRSDLFELPRRSGAEPHLLFVGALTPLKRPGDLLDAHAALLEHHPGLTTTFCGPVEDDGYVAELQRRRVPGVEWTGLVPRERVAEMLAWATALVLPSLQENVPMVIAEAMAAGVPVVASNVGGIPEMVEDGVTGLLFPPGDAAALKTALARVLADPGSAASMGAAGRARSAERYSAPAVARATVDAYREVLSWER